MSRLALIYARVSSERQATEGHGLDAQEHRCRAYAESKGYEVEKVFRDSFSGGGDFMNRPAMSALLGHADKHAHRDYVVLFDDLKRLSRDTAFYMKLKDEFRVRGIKLESPNFVMDDSDEGSFVQQILVGAAELERKQNRRQVIQKQKARLERGYWSFCPPTGYKFEKHPEHGKILVPISPEAELIKMALEGYASDKLYDQVAVRNFLKINNFRNGRPVHMSLVRRLLTETLYAGHIEYAAWEIARRKGLHQEIVSIEVFDRVQAKLTGKSYLISRKDYCLDFPLRGFVLCKDCGHPLTASWTKGKTRKYPYYWCRWNGCQLKNKSITKSGLEDRFDVLLDKIKPRPELLELANQILLDVWSQRVSKLDEHRTVLQKRLQAARRQTEGLAARLSRAQEEDLVSVYEDQLMRAGREERSLATQIERLTERSGDFEGALKQMFAVLRNPAAVWARPDIIQKRSVLKLIFSAKLRYDPVSGFQTPEKSLIYGLFEQIGAQKSLHVEVSGIEPESESGQGSESTTRSQRYL